MLRARVTGRGVNLEDVEDLQGRGMLSREYTITYRGGLEANETLVDRAISETVGRRPIRSRARTADRRTSFPKCRSKRASSNVSASPWAT